MEVFFTEYFVYKNDWQLMLDAISEMYPEYSEQAGIFSKNPFYLANNIFIMRSEWFDKMCKFVFDVLMYIDDCYREKHFVRNDRYAGYLFEVLYSIFVMCNSKDLNIAYSDMRFLG